MKRLATYIAKTAARLAGLDLLTLAYNDLGILKYQDHRASGEEYLIGKVLAARMPNPANPVILDVGANVGAITLLLRRAFPSAEIWAFEPNKAAYEVLVERTAGKRITCENIGLGNARRTETLYLPADAGRSSSASSHRKLLEDFHHAADVRETPFEMHTLDEFCAGHGIAAVDFLKIDTEGNELGVLEGARGMLSRGRVGVIQFEFGECHVFSRTFLRDFYELLEGYEFFRLDSDRLLPLGAYRVAHEIFRFQNVVAIRGAGSPG
jgi:FkbM family methyltransferase